MRRPWERGPPRCAAAPAVPPRPARPSRCAAWPSSGPPGWQKLRNRLRCHRLAGRDVQLDDGVQHQPLARAEARIRHLLCLSIPARARQTCRFSGVFRAGFLAIKSRIYLNLRQEMSESFPLKFRKISPALSRRGGRLAAPRPRIFPHILFRSITSVTISCSSAASQLHLMLLWNDLRLLRVRSQTVQIELQSLIRFFEGAPMNRFFRFVRRKSIRPSWHCLGIDRDRPRATQAGTSTRNLDKHAQKIRETARPNIKSGTYLQLDLRDSSQENLALWARSPTQSFQLHQRRQQHDVESHLLQGRCRMCIRARSTSARARSRAVMSISSDSAPQRRAHSDGSQHALSLH